MGYEKRHTAHKKRHKDTKPGHSIMDDPIIKSIPKWTIAQKTVQLNTKRGILQAAAARHFHIVTCELSRAASIQ